jgi:hypothetical protein
MECLFPISRLGSIVYSLMTDTHKMDQGLHVLTCSHGASTNEAGPEMLADKAQL